MALFGSLLGSVASKAGSQLLTQVKSAVPASAANLLETVKPFVPGSDFIRAGMPNVDFGNPGTGGGEGDFVVTGKRIEQNTDMRVRLRAQDKQKDTVYGPKTGNVGEDNILRILHETNGVLFPYTPSISVTQDVDYKTVDLVHSNYDINTYTRTPSVQLNVNAKFTVQNQYEGQYAIAVLHFFRTVSKMYFGKDDSINKLAGLPPPVLLFSGYGAYMFNELRVIVKAHSYTFDESVDMVDVRTSGNIVTRLPSLFTMSITLGIQQTPTAMREQFSLDSFRTGDLMRRGGGWI